MKYNKDIIYVTGVSHSNSSDPITTLYKCFFLGIMLNKNTSTIEDVTCNTISVETTDFIKSMLVGYNLEKDLNDMITEIQNRFFGIAQRALIVALKDAHNKYMMEKNKKI